MIDTRSEGARSVEETAALLADGLSARRLADLAAERMRSPGACPGTWARLDLDGLLAQADRLDRELAKNGKTFPLAGAVAGVKDVFDVLGLPTRSGTALTPAAPAAADAELVHRLRRAGALVAGKTSMPEFSMGATPGAVNPRNRARTPGGSSSGSAMAVADRQVAFSVGAQTNASLIRPAAFCGVFAFKPSRGVLPLAGMHCLAPALEQPGYFAGGMADLTLVHQVVIPDFVPAGRPARPLAWTRTPMWDLASPAMRDGVERLARELGATEIELPADFAGGPGILESIMNRQMFDSLTRLGLREEALTPPIARAMRLGQAVDRDAFAAALHGMRRLTALAGRVLSPWSGVLCPAALGAAPPLAEGSGSPIFSSIWSLVGAPSLNLPLLEDGGLPLGAQLVAAPGDDAELLAMGQSIAETRGV